MESVSVLYDSSKARLSNLTTYIQHCLGKFSQCSKVTDKSKEYIWEGRNKAVSIQRQHDLVYRENPKNLKKQKAYKN